jgi:hypothetical protein
VAIANNEKSFDLLFVLNRLVEMKLISELLVMNRQKIMYIKTENVTWSDSLNFKPMPLRKLPEDFDHSAERLWYHHLVNTTENINYACPAPEVSYYSVDLMHE